jgi:hypothetical protein
MNILLVGALSWNPERVRVLAERGHQLWGLWSRSMSWDQGPYRVTEDCVRPVTLAEAARTIREERIGCVYSLFQVYHPRLWGPARGLEHDVWTLLRELLLARERGEFDAPIVRHWGFDVHNMDLEVARAFDGQIFCNREKLDYWTKPLASGGCGLELVSDGDVTAFLDSDRPKQEFMTEGLPEPLSARTGELHTVCIGRPFGLDYLALARRGVHVHLYGNTVDDLYQMMARDLTLASARREASMLRRFVHVHPSLQAADAPWSEVRRVKSTWAKEFARYDAGWSYVGSPLLWEPLDDRAVIPNRISTYLLAGLPVISDRRPGYYRYDELARLGINLDLVDRSWDGLRHSLEAESRSGERRANALRQRKAYSFDATVDALLALLERARERYFARPHRERTRFTTGRRRFVHFNTSPDPRALVRGLLRRVMPPSGAPGAPPDGRLHAVGRALSERARRQMSGWKGRLLARRLRGIIEIRPEQPQEPSP